MAYVGHAQLQEFIGRTADDLAKPPVDEEELTVQFTLNDTNAGLLEDPRETLLAGPKRVFRPNPACGLNHGNEHAAHAAGSLFVRYGAVADGKATVFPIGRAVALDFDKKILCKERAARSAQDGLVQRPELRLNFRPRLMKRQAEGHRMLVAEDRPVAVIIDHHEFGAPPDAHWKPRSEHDFYDQRQTGRPILGRSEDGFGPILGTDPIRHFRRAGNTSRVARHCRVQNTLSPIHGSQGPRPNPNILIRWAQSGTLPSQVVDAAQHRDGFVFPKGNPS
jgi:hypothetical protein